MTYDVGGIPVRIILTSVLHYSTQYMYLHQSVPGSTECPVTCAGGGTPYTSQYLHRFVPRSTECPVTCVGGDTPCRVRYYPSPPHSLPPSGELPSVPGAPESVSDRSAASPLQTVT